MPDLSVFQYELVYNMLSLTIACMFASFLFFVLGKENIAPRYRGSVIASALVVAIAGYHYFRIFNSWEAAYMLDEATGMYVATGAVFNDAYRYVDWLLTVPLLMVELVLVLGLSAALTRSLIAKLTIAAFLMIALGYPGELLRDDTSLFSERGLWGFLSTIPFVYILVIVLKHLREAMKNTTPQIAVLLRNTGLLTLFTWGFYPIAYMAPFYGLQGGSAEAFLQVGYSIADIAAKCGYGLLIFNIARLRTIDEFGGSEVEKNFPKTKAPDKEAVPA
ncbi:MAG: bacteriorhodopsin [Verrucomicrobiota bacterium]